MENETQIIKERTSKIFSKMCINKHFRKDSVAI